MAQDDWAIVVGVNGYPDLGPLDGPENDARAFYDWVTSPEGGVPKEQARLILSADFPAAARADAAQPTAERVEDELRGLDQIAQANNRARRGLRVGRRLYLYLAGHGFAPQEAETLLMTADASSAALERHVRGSAYASWFHFAGYFREVVLFMDCCRERYRRMGLRPLIFPERIDHAAVDHPRPFCGYATKWTRKAREKPLGPQGAARGVFTTALLSGLRGAARGPAGQVTGRSLMEYLYNNMQQLLSEDDLRDPEIPKQPDFSIDPDPALDLVFTSGPPPRSTVRVHAPGHAGARIEVLDASFTVRATDTLTSAEWQVALEPGLYLLRVPDHGKEVPIQVSGLEDEQRRLGGGFDVEL